MKNLGSQPWLFATGLRGVVLGLYRPEKAPHHGEECEAFRTASLGEGGGLSFRLASDYNLPMTPEQQNKLS